MVVSSQRLLPVHVSRMSNHTSTVGSEFLGVLAAVSSKNCDHIGNYLPCVV